MSSRGSSRGGRGARSGLRGRGRGASATAASPSTRPSVEESTAVSSGDGGRANAEAPAVVTAPRAVTIDSSHSATQSPTPAPTPARGRFKPKNIRRDAAERQKLEEERNRDLQARIKIEERENARRARRGARGRGRGRGDGRGHFIRRTVTGAGAFSGISQDMVKQGGSSWGPRSGGSGFKSESQYYFGPRYQDRRANDIRVNVDNIRDSLAPEEGLGSGSGSSPLPVGIIRVEHKQAEVKVATSAELEAEEQEGDDDDDLFVDTQSRIQRDIVMADDNEVWDADPNKSNEKEVQVKAEPGTEQDDVMEIDAIAPKAKEPPSPELKKKPLAEDLEDNAKAKAKEKKREKALQDLEVQNLASDAVSALQGLTLKDGGGPQEKDNKFFVFQFPPVLPPLLRLNSEGKEIVDLDEIADTDGVQIKTEEGTSAPIPTSSAMPRGGGYIGRLNVRKSGKVELDWGGRVLDLGIATDTDFLTTVIVVDELENDTPAGAGKATGMGEIFGKFVATPIFEEEADWEPDLESLGLST